mgnify:CR=1 FL=1
MLPNPAAPRTLALRVGPSLAGREGMTVASALAEPAMDVETVIESLLERDPSLNRSMLLRLIAGVRGL